MEMKFQLQNMDISSKTMSMLSILRVKTIDISFNGSVQDYLLIKSLNIDLTSIFLPITLSFQVKFPELVLCKVMRMILF